MLRRLFDGLLLALLAWLALTRLDAGGVVLGLALAAVLAFTGWRIARLWRKYQILVRELAAAEAAGQSDDPDERARAERIIRERHGGRTAAEMTIWTGFVLGAAAVDGAHAAAMAQGAEAAGYDGVGSDVGGGGAFGGGGDGGGGM